MKNPNDKVREELSDLICRELTGSLDDCGSLRLRELEATYGLKKTETSHIVHRLRQPKEFEYTDAWINFQQTFGTKKQTIHLNYSIQHIWIPAAALVILFLGIWLLMGSPQEMTEEQNLVKNEQILIPGKSTAFITLANGERIELGNNIKEVKEVNGTCLNLDSSAVVYKADPAVSGQLIHNTLTTPKGGEYKLILADGTKVWVNAESELRYPVHFTGKCREVYLQGEVYFEVAKDATRPFIVHTSRGAIKVLGTEFNVRDYGDEKKVVATLVNGKVTYDSPQRGSKTIVLNPGYQVEDYEGANPVTRKVDVNLYVSWKDGKFIFENSTLEEIMQSLCRWYDFTVVYKRKEMKQLHFTGDLERYDNINDFLEFMEIGGNVRFKINGNVITIE